jgi:hypothetical protein
MECGSMENLSDQTEHPSAAHRNFGELLGYWWDANEVLGTEELRVSSCDGIGALKASIGQVICFGMRGYGEFMSSLALRVQSVAARDATLRMSVERERLPLVWRVELMELQEASSIILSP